MNGEVCWSIGQAVEICTLIEEGAPRFGCHIALTGGCLYKKGLRKDLDIVVYRIRQVKQIDVNGFRDFLSSIGIQTKDLKGWLMKGESFGKALDFFFPENPLGEYDAYGEEEKEKHSHEENQKIDLPF